MAQSWLRLSIRTGAADIDTFSNFVIERGSPGIVVKRDGLDAFFPRSRKDAALRREVRRFVDAHGGADLLIAAFVCEQSSQDFFSNRMFGGIQRAVTLPL